MRRADELPLDPEVAGGLDAIDAALAGQPVDPGRRELAELALVLADDRPRMDPDFALELDERVARPRPARRVPRGRSWWVWSPAAGLAGCLLVAGVIVATQGNGGPAHTATTVEQFAPSRAPAASAPAHTAAGSTASQGVSPATGAAVYARPGAAAQPQPAGPLLQPPANGRKLTQSAQLALTVSSDKIDAVAQEVYNVVGQAQGVVNNSTVTAGGSTGGYAQFQLSVPSASLPQTMASLSGLRYAQVASRTDNVQDVTDEYQRDVRQLADARALRTSLLRQLAGATTQSQIDSLTARIHDAEASISSDQATLAKLNHQIGFSQVTVTINAGSVPPADASGGGFTLGKAAHTAGRVLTVAAGVILVGAAGLVPLALLVALLWWTAAMLRHRRREQALDAS